MREGRGVESSRLLTVPPLVGVHEGEATSRPILAPRSHSFGPPRLHSALGDGLEAEVGMHLLAFAAPIKHQGHLPRAEQAYVRGPVLTHVEVNPGKFVVQRRLSSDGRGIRGLSADTAFPMVPYIEPGVGIRDAQGCAAFPVLAATNVCGVFLLVPQREATDLHGACSLGIKLERKTEIGSRKDPVIGIEGAPKRDDDVAFALIALQVEQLVVERDEIVLEPEPWQAHGALCALAVVLVTLCLESSPDVGLSPMRDRAHNVGLATEVTALVYILFRPVIDIQTVKRGNGRAGHGRLSREGVSERRERHLWL
ncbi:hypothetical protein FA10DRAFT_201894 [Acaromyces ingoldii]|uniref:Uncharacterized protein n=1 Tax=Acaromyces ingoldii TaxID=215250 RepID=A0A316YE07_9BASI|nr:hypothetical protein FA10DRAFT_201894 [Acaromyces ingoldii]PWN86878.1 hypothetical protein FA10DRAFT_201894 [Acaromyces ingoldii]